MTESKFTPEMFAQIEELDNFSKEALIELDEGLQKIILSLENERKVRQDYLAVLNEKITSAREIFADIPSLKTMQEPLENLTKAGNEGVVELNRVIEELTRVHGLVLNKITQGPKEINSKPN